MRTAATEVRDFFSKVSTHKKKRIGEAIAAIAQTHVNSQRFFLTVASARANCDQLKRDIWASHLKQASAKVYTDAVDILASHLTLTAMHEKQADVLLQHRQAFDYLAMLDDLLKPLDNISLGSAQYEELRMQANTLLQSIHESEIEARLKDFLCRQVETFVWSLQSYRILGADGVSRAWGAMTAEIIRSQGFEVAKESAAQTWYKRYLPAVAAIGLVVSGTSTAVEKVDKLVTSGAHLTGLMINSDTEK